MANILNIVYHSSDLFAPVLGTSMASVFENNKSMDEINIYVFENPLSDENKNRLTKLANNYGRKVFFLRMPDMNKEQNMGLVSVGKKGWFFNSYVKLYLDVYLPETVERVLYLDSDVLVVNDLTELINIDMEGHPAAAVTDCLGEKYYSLLGLEKNTKYCNSGIILEDLKLWREKKVGDKVKDYIKKNGGYVFFMEQTAFNGALQDDILILHPKYNTYTMMQILSYEEIKKLRKCDRFYTKEEIAEAVANPYILHLTNTFLLSNRTWYENSKHPEYSRYQHYKALTPWKDEPDFKDVRDWKQIVVQFGVDSLPRGMVLRVAEYLYNKRRVKKIEKLIEQNQKKQ